MANVDSVSETSDDYRRVVCMLDAKTRVIESACGIQWIIQRRINGNCRWPWKSQYYCRSKMGLLMYAKPHTPELLALPEWFPEVASGEAIKTASGLLTTP